MTTIVTIANLTDTLAASAEITKKAAKEQIEAVLGLVAASVAEGNTVRLHNFGTFSVTERAARTGRNPQTGEPLDIAASKAVKFKVSAPFKKAVNGSAE